MDAFIRNVLLCLAPPVLFVGLGLLGVGLLILVEWFFGSEERDPFEEPPTTPVFRDGQFEFDDLGRDYYPLPNQRDEL
jgi:hypothetical protein